MPEFYVPELIVRMREIARECGWTLGIHGSMVRDWDLIAVPWAAEAKPWKELYRLWLERLPVKDTEGTRIDSPPGRPFNRKSLLILHKDAVRVEDGNPKGTWNPPCLDVSFMVPVEPVNNKLAAALNRIRTENHWTTVHQIIDEALGVKP